MSVNGSFQVQLTCIMETLTTSAVAEITKLFDYSSSLLFSEIYRQREENEALRKELHRMETKERGKSSVDVLPEVQLSDDTQNDEAVSELWFPDKPLVCSEIYGADACIEMGETNALQCVTVKNESPEVKQVIFHHDHEGEDKSGKDEEASHPDEVHVRGQANGGRSLGDEIQVLKENQADAHSSTLEPQEEDTNLVFSDDLEMCVKSEPGSESESDMGRSTPSGEGNWTLDHHTRRDRHTCVYCKKCFKYRSQVIIHERVHTRERPFVCKQCGKGFSQINNLKKHQVCHNGRDRDHTCKECGKVFRHVQSLRNHMTSAHSFDADLDCGTCGKTFFAKNALDAHSNTHNRAFCCEVCGKAFSTKQILKSHQLTHTGERPYICDYCGKGFAYQCNLKTHKRVHTGEKPFGCERCGRYFSQKHVLEKHVCKA
ncbi:hypothetical protein UPYG_G00046980 [Umbra pygmaea]|uniref:C2H2-type domain-containing protein n=1 Tax=Umbra pygmaea TaxID=75934 RepID=A0ABD0Y4P1_UMBPY